jgi:hypothetical protein
VRLEAGVIVLAAQQSRIEEESRSSSGGDDRHRAGSLTGEKSVRIPIEASASAR